MKKLFLLFVFLLIFSFVSAETRVTCQGSGTSYSGVFPSDSFCEIPVLNERGTVKVGVSKSVFPSNGNFEFSIYSSFQISSKFDPQGFFSEKKLDCGPLGYENWNIYGYLEDKYPQSVVCDTQRGIFRKDVDLVGLTVSEKPDSKALELQINLYAEDAFKEYLALVFGKTVSEADFRSISQQFSIFDSSEIGRITRIKSGNLKTNADIHLSSFEKEEKAVFKIMQRETNNVFCENIEVLFDSDGKKVDCDSFGSVKISFNAEETEKYTEDSSKGKEYFFNIEVKLNDSDALSEEKPSEDTDNDTDNDLGDKLKPIPSGADLIEIQNLLNENILIKYCDVMNCAVSD